MEYYDLLLSYTDLSKMTSVKVGRMISTEKVPRES